MKSLMLTNLIIILYILPYIKLSYQKYIYETNYIDVPIDHFSFTNNATFKLRYLVNDTHWNSDGPIFFYTGNEGDIEVFAQNTGFVWEIASEFRALIVFAEHRYYGQSLPFGNLSYTSPQYVGYLTSSQALADYVFLIEYIQQLNGVLTHGNKNPVIAFGGSYGGMLAAWIRMKYPASVLGAIAASAPVWQFQTPCETFNRIVTSVFKISTNHDCPKFIRKSWPAIREVTATPAGKQWLTSKWKLCRPLENQDIPILFDWLQEVYTDLAMVNYPYPANFITSLPGHPVKSFCNALVNIPTKPEALLEELGKALTVYTNYTRTSKCVDITQPSTNSIGDRGWDFQACTEMVMPMCSTDQDMFENEPWNFTNFAAECYKVWKVRITRPDLAVLEYGGKNLHAASNIVFSNGLLDPWSGGGVLNNISKTVLAILIPEAAHHLDFRARNPSDPASVIEARNFHKRVIHGWLRSYYQENYNLYYN